MGWTDQPVSAEIEIYPIQVTAVFLAAKQNAVKGTRHGGIMHGNGQVKV